MSDEPRIEEASSEVERPAGSARLPGARRDGYTRFPTGPVGIEPVVVSGPRVDQPLDWEPTGPIQVSAKPSLLAPWALLAAIVALIASFFVGWGIPVALVSIVAAIMSLRRANESKAMGVWALVLASIATVYSAGWLIWSLGEMGVWG